MAHKEEANQEQQYQTQQQYNVNAGAARSADVIVNLVGYNARLHAAAVAGQIHHPNMLGMRNA